MGFDLILRISHGHTGADCFQHLDIIEAISKSDGFFLRKAKMLKYRAHSVSLPTFQRNDISRSIPPCCDLCMVRIFQNPLILFFPAGTHHLIDVLMNPFIELFIDFQHLITESEILLQIRICTVGDDKMFVTDCYRPMHVFQILKDLKLVHPIKRALKNNLVSDCHIRTVKGQKRIEINPRKTRRRQISSSGRHTQLHPILPKVS